MADSDHIRQRVVIAGYVQGVGFRLAGFSRIGNFDSKAEKALQIVSRIALKRHQGGGSFYTLEPLQPPRHNLSHGVVLSDANDGNQIEVARD